jgi:hypothetical protein
MGTTAKMAQMFFSNYSQDVPVRMIVFFAVVQFCPGIAFSSSAPLFLHPIAGI